MKIEALAIQGFGKWSQFSLNNLKDWQVIAGPNEAGKSTLNAFILGVLFGFPSRAKGRNLYEPVDGSRYGGSLIVKIDKQHYQITRLDRTSSQLTVENLDNHTQIENPSDWLENQLGKMSLSEYQAIYSFDLLALEEIKKLSAQDLERLLLNLGTGQGEGWFQYAQQLNRQADQKYTVSTTGRRPLNRALKAYQQDEQALQSLAGQVADFVGQENQIQLKKDQLQEQRLTLQKQEERVNQLSQAQKQYGLYQEAQQIQKKHLQDTVKVIDQQDYQQAQKLSLEIEALQASIDQLNQEQKQVLTPLTLSAAEARQVYQMADSIQRINYLKLSMSETKADLAQIQEKFPGRLPAPLQAHERSLLIDYNKMLAITLGLNGAIILGLILHLPIWLIVFLAVGAIWQDYRCFNQYQQRQQLLARYQPLLPAAILAEQDQLQNAQRQQAQILTQTSELGQLQDELRPTIENLLAKVGIINYQEELPVLYQRLKEQAHLTQDSLQGRLTDTASQQLTLLTNYQERLAALNQAITAIFSRYQVGNMADLMQGLAQYQNYQRYQQRYQDIQGQIDQKQLQVILHNIKDENSLNDQLQREQIEVNNLASAVQQGQEELAQLEANYQAGLTSDQYLALQQNLASQQSELTEALTDYLSQKLSSQWIEQVLTENSAHRFPRMQTIAQEYFSQMTLEAYQQISFTNGELLVINANGQRLPIYQLSMGTKEQLYLALRLAMVKVLEDVVDLPILIDDALVNFDPQRRQQMLSLLQKLAQTHQIIYWTSQSDGEVLDSLTLR
ncbi:ATP-binding protein [Convivina intestini]|uniref:AAA domain-containing protein n=1 Tax=Convivina intestini TaxID=1505726 RepID=A0A2U1DC04_9LACO|nr:AAA family ATPase [Convivina intestini]PVY85186.1 AAA domain-containing protein [Convivina intestini]CAH1852326.1 hypothetical protein R077811_00403 [Convivina intestini]CAH1854564.1 hypothetical protein R078131_00987 [Convivina intestini]SDC00015.1 AAA domain-containing protein [Leuconostocaceae bacterium R-53105]